MMRAITIRQPWADAIETGAKNVENRTWVSRQLQIGDQLAIHAGATAANGAALVYMLEKRGIAVWGVARRSQHYGTTGAVIAVVDYLGAHEDTDEDPHDVAPWRECCGSPWAFRGARHWVLGNVQHLRAPVPVPGGGRLGVWTLPDDVEADVRRQVVVPRG